MISVSEAQAICLSLVTRTNTETVPLEHAQNRTLSAAVSATRDQPPFPASAMDGYAVTEQDAREGAKLEVIAEAAAGRGWSGTLAPGHAVRIFTGAPVPDGADRVVIQENVTQQGSCATLTAPPSEDRYIRPQGADFKAGFTLNAPCILTPSNLALCASMNLAQLPVARAPRVAILSTGNELVEPGGTPAPDQIIASNAIALAALIRATGGEPIRLPLVPDTPEALDAALLSATEQKADIIVTIGGASVGDHDLVAPALRRFGVALDFHKIAMRPGKPLMAGSKGPTAVLGLPGNPVSSLVCGQIFLAPMIRQALGRTEVLPIAHPARLTAPLPKGGPRSHYMRAYVAETPTGREVTPYPRQDSALLTVLAQANALLLHPAHAPARNSGDLVDVIVM